MSKSAEQRFQTERLLKRWKHLLSSVDSERSLECISFGRVFSRDPFDCGHPQCPLCSHEKVFYPKRNRILNRYMERVELSEFLQENEIDASERESA